VSTLMTTARILELETNIGALMGTFDNELWQMEGTITTADCMGRVTYNLSSPQHRVRSSSAPFCSSRESHPLPGDTFPVSYAPRRLVEFDSLVGSGYIVKRGETYSRTQQKVRIKTNPSGYKIKIWKANKSIKKLVLGFDVGLEETYRMALCGLVNRVSYRYLVQESLTFWMDKCWAPILGYPPKVLYLLKGWLGFICRTLEETSLLLASRWVFGGNSLMLKRWLVAFDPASDYFQQCHLWVLLPGLPIQLWNEGSLKEIDDSLGMFIISGSIVFKGSGQKGW
jgi:hypothetical protein